MPISWGVCTGNMRQSPCRAPGVAAGRRAAPGRPAAAGGRVPVRRRRPRPRAASARERVRTASPTPLAGPLISGDRLLEATAGRHRRGRRGSRPAAVHDAGGQATGTARRWRTAGPRGRAARREPDPAASDTPLTPPPSRTTPARCTAFSMPYAALRRQRAPGVLSAGPRAPASAPRLRPRRSYRAPPRDSGHEAAVTGQRSRVGGRATGGGPRGGQGVAVETT